LTSIVWMIIITGRTLGRDSFLSRRKLCICFRDDGDGSKNNAKIP